MRRLLARSLTLVRLSVGLLLIAHMVLFWPLALIAILVGRFVEFGNAWLAPLDIVAKSIGLAGEGWRLLGLFVELTAAFTLMVFGGWADELPGHRRTDKTGRPEQP